VQEENVNEVSEIRAAVGTNSWGSRAYGTILRGSYVPTETLSEAVECAKSERNLAFDVARDYGFGEAEKILGKIGAEGLSVSAKYTPFRHYKTGCVKKSVEKDFADLKIEKINIFWLHAPTDIEEHLKEIIEIKKEGKIENIGVSNFNLAECKTAKAILEADGIPLFGVQNHYSLICRRWEENGLVGWCRENGVQFWAWAVLEEGILANPNKKSRFSLMDFAFRNQRKKLKPLYEKMEEIGRLRSLSSAQIAMAFVASKGIVPMCGCRTPAQVQALANAVKTPLSEEEIRILEETADSCHAKVLGEDVFRMFVLKSKK